MNNLDIEEGAGEVSRALKIEDKRANELKDLCCDAVAHYNTIPECMDVIQTYAKNANEQAYCNYRIGVCSRCPGSIIKREIERRKDADDMDNSLGKIWDND